MTNQPPSSQPHSPNSTPGANSSDAIASNTANGTGQNSTYSENFVANQALSALAHNQTAVPSAATARTHANRPIWQRPPTAKTSPLIITLLSVAIMVVGLTFNNFWMGLAGALVALIVSLRIVWPSWQAAITELVSPQEQAALVGTVGFVAAIIGLIQISGLNRNISRWFSQLDWDAVGALGEVFGALGQILIAVLAVYIAWRQYVISKDLTIQQNIITQQQTIDTYFQGISDLVLDEQGLLEDWPQERAIAEGRTAAILSSIDAGGKAKVIRFLSRARLLTPLKRDRRLGRAILDGTGGYEEDRVHGVRVIDLGVMLAGANLAATDLRWTDLSEANLVRANLSGCDLVKANLARTILYEAQLRNADLEGAKLFYGSLDNASPRSRVEPPDYNSGIHTGAVVENADFTGVQLSEEQRCYCCAWGGSKTRNTIMGGCEGIPNKLGR